MLFALGNFFRWPRCALVLTIAFGLWAYSSPGGWPPKVCTFSCSAILPAMSERNDGLSRDATRSILYPEAPPYTRQSSGYPSARRPPRWSRHSNAPSWVSQGVLPPMGGASSPYAVPTSPGSRPLPVPSPAPSRGMSDFQPVYPSPSELGPEPEPETHHSSYPGPPSEPREEREYDAPEENMTIGPSVNDFDYPDYNGTQQEAIPEDEQYPGPPTDGFAPEIPLEGDRKGKSRARTFVGGFMAGLKKIPGAVVRSPFYDRSATRKGAPGTENPLGGSSHFLPAYNDPGTTVADPSTFPYISTRVSATQPKSPTDLSNAERSGRSSHPSRRASHPLSYGSHRSSSHANTTSAIVSPGPRFISADAVAVEPQPGSDYAKMDSPIRFARPDDSFSTHITRVHDFFRDLKELPWTSDRVAIDYEPTRSGRAFVGKMKPAGSWYTSNKHQDIDLLAPASNPPRHSALHLRSVDGGTTASIRSGTRITPDYRSPIGSYMTSPVTITTSPGASSHGQGQQGMSYSYYFAPPQPLYVYPSPMSTPITSPSGMSSSPGPSPPEGHHPQAVPVFMIPGPPPGLLSSPAPAHTAVRHQSPHGTVTPANVPLPQSPMPPLTHPRHSGSSSH